MLLSRLLLLAGCTLGASFNPPPASTFATFGNAATKALIKQWSPRPLPVADGDVMLPSSTDNMKRFVRARILLEDPSTGCIAALNDDDKMCLILVRFTKAQHSLLLPLWQPSVEPKEVFTNLVDWHAHTWGEKSDSPPTAQPLITGKTLEWAEDKRLWSEAGFGI
jgi:hypothetical protein